MFALGGLVEYNFGPASFSVWATQEIAAGAASTRCFPIPYRRSDTSLITQGMTVFANLSYRIWAPEEPPKPAMFHK